MVFRSSNSTTWVKSAQSNAVAQQLASRILQKEMRSSDLDAMRDKNHPKHNETLEACAILFAVYVIGHSFREVFRAQKASEACRAVARVLAVVPLFRLWRAIGYHIGLRSSTMPTRLIRSS